MSGKLELQNVPVFHLCPYGQTVQIGHFGTHGTGWDNTVHLLLTYENVPRCPICTTVPTIPAVLGHKCGTVMGQVARLQWNIDK